MTSSFSSLQVAAAALLQISCTTQCTYSCLCSFHDIIEIQDRQYTHLILASLKPWVFIVAVPFSGYASRGSTEARSAK